MVRFSVLAVVAALSLAACDGPDPGIPISATSPPPMGEAGEVETPNSLPPSGLINAPAEQETEVIGVRHLPP